MSNYEVQEKNIKENRKLIRALLKKNTTCKWESFISTYDGMLVFRAHVGIITLEITHGGVFRKDPDTFHVSFDVDFHYGESAVVETIDQIIPVLSKYMGEFIQTLEWRK